MKRPLAWLCLAGALVAPSACDRCSSEAGDAPKPEASGVSLSGLRDVKKACEHRAAWPHRLRAKCTKCVSGAAAPPCGCKADEKAYTALCADQQRAKLDAKDCEEIFLCAAKCKPTDCDCRAKCFDGHDKCHKIQSELDGCIAETCDNYCRPK